jgi:hypothetical protein
MPDAAPERKQGYPGSTRTRPGVDLRGLFAQIGETVERETAMLARGTRSGFEDIVARKQRGLMDLSAAIGDSRVLLEPGEQSALSDLRRKLDANAQALRAHVQASREIAALLRDAARDADSDGTYTARPAFKR